MLSAVLCLVSLSLVSSDVTKLPDTSGIDFVLTEKLGVDKFFSLWLVFNNGDVKTSAWFLLCEDVLQKTCGWRRPITATSLNAHQSIPSPFSRSPFQRLKHLGAL
uniref:Uncharacterized protein n=1 Tax=Timema genevievae TaxID=629358 RepID=A0A7R9JX76_TIMGE|nr:unnamed protein product [Timema genevievae]